MEALNLTDKEQTGDNVKMQASPEASEKVMPAWTYLIKLAITLVCSIILTVPCVALATDASPPVSDEDLLKEKRFQQPENWEWHFFKNADGASIRYGQAQAKDPRGTIILVTGFTEFGEVYFELINDLLQQHWNVCEMDWRGEGGSDRYLDDREKAYSLGFDHDSNDLAQLIETVVKPQGKQKLVLMAHSLGSHIALRFLHDHPGLVDKAILSAPAVDLTTKENPTLVSIMTWWQCTTGNGKNYTDDQGNWAFMEPKVCKAATHSHDAERVRLEAAWVKQNSQLASGGATWKWLQEYQKSLDIIWSGNYLKDIKTPVLMGCPNQDLIIKPYKQRQCIRKIPGAQVWEGEWGRHDLFLESDFSRKPWLERALNFARI
jgi:lysophospholipase